MYFDALTTSAIATELRAELLDGRVQQIVLPNRLSVALEIYAHRQRRPRCDNHTLSMSLTMDN